MNNQLTWQSGVPQFNFLHGQLISNGVIYRARFYNNSCLYSFDIKVQPFSQPFGEPNSINLNCYIDIYHYWQHGRNFWQEDFLYWQDTYLQEFKEEAERMLIKMQNHICHKCFKFCSQQCFLENYAR